MNDVCRTSRLQMHPNYERLADLTHTSHERGRAALGIRQRDITLARLYSHAFRAHVIGAFHATRKVLFTATRQMGPGKHGVDERSRASAGHPTPLAVQPSMGEMTVADPLARLQLRRAGELLTDLANRGMDDVGRDARALISTFHHYCTHVARTVEALDAACQLVKSHELGQIRDRFVRQMELITSCNGIHVRRDTEVPEQGSFIVPNLGVTIVPLVYGDHHSWNLAWLEGDCHDVPYHLHREGVEIHLGYGPLHGFTVLGEAKAEVTEAYAMPIPPDTRHGYTNLESRSHHVPFIFGSQTCGGWGVFLDVEPQPLALDQLTTMPLLSHSLNGTVLLDRQIEQAAKKLHGVRYTIIPAEMTDRNGVGGLELSVARVTSRGLSLRSDRFCAVSIVRGCGVVTIAGERRKVTPHDHFGVPANVTAEIHQVGEEPLVLLDAVLKPGRRSSY